MWLYIYLGDSFNFFRLVFSCFAVHFLNWDSSFDGGRRYVNWLFAVFNAHFCLRYVVVIYFLRFWFKSMLKLLSNVPTINDLLNNELLLIQKSIDMFELRPWIIKCLNNAMSKQRCALQHTRFIELDLFTTMRHSHVQLNSQITQWYGTTLESYQILIWCASDTLLGRASFSDTAFYTH